MTQCRQYGVQPLARRYFAIVLTTLILGSVACEGSTEGPPSALAAGHSSTEEPSASEAEEARSHGVDSQGAQGESGKEGTEQTEGLTHAVQTLPAPGLYSMAEKLSQPDGSTSRSTLRIRIHAGETMPNSASRVREEHLSNGPPDSSNSEIQLWLADGVFWERVVKKFKGKEESCVFEEHILVRRNPLVIGDSWTSGSQCRSPDGEQMEVQLKPSVKGQERVTIGGETFETVVLVTHWRISEKGVLAVTKDETSWFAPDLGLVLRYVTRSQSTLFGSGDSEGELESVHPE